MSWPVGSLFLHMLSVRPSVPLFKSRKTKLQKTMFAIGVTMGLAEWIIDDIYLVMNYFCSCSVAVFHTSYYVSNHGPYHGSLVWHRDEIQKHIFLLRKISIFEINRKKCKIFKNFMHFKQAINFCQNHLHSYEV